MQQEAHAASLVFNGRANRTGAGSGQRDGITKAPRQLGETNPANLDQACANDSWTPGNSRVSAQALSASRWNAWKDFKRAASSGLAGERTKDQLEARNERQNYQA